MNRFETVLADTAATEAFGARLAACCGGGLVVFLSGELGAGKTTLVRGLLRALGHVGPVKSPTYTLVESYQPGEFPLHHFDLYRLADAEELEWLGIRDLMSPEAVCLFEWPQRGRGLLPSADLLLTLAYHSPGRRVTVEAHTARGEALLGCLS